MTVAGARIVPVGQPRRLSDDEAAAFAARDAQVRRDMVRVEAALRALNPGSGEPAFELRGGAPTAWRCGFVRFANRPTTRIDFIARPDHDPADLIMARDDESLARVKSVCGFGSIDG